MATSKKPKETPALTPSEEVKDIPKNVIPIGDLTPQERAKQDIVKYDTQRGWIAERKAAYALLQIIDENDKPGLAAVTDAWREMKNKRILVEKTRKALGEDAKIYKQVVDAEGNALQTLISEVEDELKAKIDAIELKKEQLKKEKEEAEMREQSRRIDLLQKNGMAFTGTGYQIGEGEESIGLSATEIKTLTADEFNELLEGVSEKNEAIKQAAADKIKADEEEKQRLAQQKADQDAEAKRQADDNLAFRKEVRESRHEQIISLGYTYSEGQEKFTYKKSASFCEFDEVDFADLSTKDWQQLIKEAKDSIAKVNEKQTKADEQKAATEYKNALVKSRISDLHALDIEPFDEGYAYIDFKTKEAAAFVAPIEVNEATNEHWQDILHQCKKAIEVLKSAIAEKQQAASDRSMRIHNHTFELIQLGFMDVSKLEFKSRYTPETTGIVLDEELALDTDEWADFKANIANKVQEIKDADAAKEKADAETKESARVEALNDKDRVDEFLHKLAQAMAGKPKLNSVAINSYFSTFEQNLNQEIDWLIKATESASK